MSSKIFTTNPDIVLKNPEYDSLREQVRSKNNTIIGRNIKFFDMFFVDTKKDPRVLATNIAAVTPGATDCRLSLEYETCKHLIQEMDVDLNSAFPLHPERDIFNEVKLSQYQAFKDEFGIRKWKQIKGRKEGDVVDGFLVRVGTRSVLFYKDLKAHGTDGTMGPYLKGLAGIPDARYSNVGKDNRILQVRFQIGEMTWTAHEQETVSSFVNNDCLERDIELFRDFYNKLNNHRLSSNDASGLRGAQTFGSYNTLQSLIRPVSAHTAKKYSKHLSTLYILLLHLEDFQEALGGNVSENLSYLQELGYDKLKTGSKEERFEAFFTIISSLTTEPDLFSLGINLFKLSLFTFESGVATIRRDSDILFAMEAWKLLLKVSVFRKEGAAGANQHLPAEINGMKNTGLLQNIKDIYYKYYTEMQDIGKFRVDIDDTKHLVRVGNQFVRFEDFKIIHNNALLAYDQAFKGLQNSFKNVLSPARAWNTLTKGKNAEVCASGGTHFYNYFKQSAIASCNTELSDAEKKNSADKLGSIITIINGLTHLLMNIVYIDGGCRLRFTEIQLLCLEGPNRSVHFEWKHKRVLFRPTYEKNGKRLMRMVYLSTVASKYLLHYSLVVRPLLKDIIFKCANVKFNLNRDLFEREFFGGADDEEEAVEAIMQAGAIEIASFPTFHELMEAENIVDSFLFLNFDFTAKNIRLGSRIRFNTVLDRCLKARDGRHTSIRIFRQAAAALFRKIVVDGFITVPYYAELAFGHSPRTGVENYGITNGAVRDDVVERNIFFFLSREWWSWTGICDPLDFTAGAEVPKLEEDKKACTQLPVIDQESLIKAAQLVYGSGYQERNNQLFTSLAMGNFQRKYYFHQAATGAGKTVCFQLPLVALKMSRPREFINIVVVPYVPLKKNMVSRLSSNLKVGQLGSLMNASLNNFFDVYVVSVHEMSDPCIKYRLAQYDAAGCLGYLIYDEGHLLHFDKEYRSDQIQMWLEITRFSFFKVAIFSATLFGDEIFDGLKADFSLKSEDYTKFNNVISLPHKDRIFISKEEGDHDAVMQRLKKIDVDKKTFLICKTKADVRTLSLRCEETNLKSRFICMTGDDSTADKEDLIERFIHNPQYCLIIGTQLLTHGIDVPNTTQVIVYNFRMSAYQLIQTIGRIRGKGIAHLINEECVNYCPTQVIRSFYEIEGKGCDTCCKTLRDEDLKKLKERYEYVEELDGADIESSQLDSSDSLFSAPAADSSVVECFGDDSVNDYCVDTVGYDTEGSPAGESSDNDDYPDDVSVNDYGVDAFSAVGYHPESPPAGEFSDNESCCVVDPPTYQAHKRPGTQFEASTAKKPKMTDKMIERETVQEEKENWHMSKSSLFGNEEIFNNSSTHLYLWICVSYMLSVRRGDDRCRNCLRSYCSNSRNCTFDHLIELRDTAAIAVVLGKETMVSLQEYCLGKDIQELCAKVSSQDRELFNKLRHLYSQKTLSSKVKLTYSVQEGIKDVAHDAYSLLNAHNGSNMFELAFHFVLTEEDQRLANARDLPGARAADALPKVYCGSSDASNLGHEEAFNERFFKWALFHLDLGGQGRCFWCMRRTCQRQCKSKYSTRSFFYFLGFNETIREKASKFVVGGEQVKGIQMWCHLMKKKLDNDIWFADIAAYLWYEEFVRYRSLQNQRR